LAEVAESNFSQGAELARLGKKCGLLLKLQTEHNAHSFSRGEGKVDSHGMHSIKIPAPMRFCLSVAGVLLALTASGIFAAEDENWLLAARPVVRERGSLLRGLLTWPKDEGDKEKEGGEKEEEEEEEPLESDRPDFTNTPTTVGYHRFQIESGYTYTQAIAGDPIHDAHDLPELLVRYGVAERLELRVAWDEGMMFDRYTDRTSGRVVAENGGTDVDFGFKYAISKQDKWRPQSGIQIEGSAPVGAPGQSSRQVDAFVNYLYSWELTKKLSLGCSTGSLWTAESGDHFWRFSQSASLEYELTEKLHVFNEWFAFFRRDSSDNRPQHYYDAGLTYLVTPNFQLDWRAGLGLNDASDGFFTGCGLTIRR
jgi:hypothetical protein